MFTGRANCLGTHQGGVMIRAGCACFAMPGYGLGNDDMVLPLRSGYTPRLFDALTATEAPIPKPR